jgi:hypothetical protein
MMFTGREATPSGMVDVLECEHCGNVMEVVSPVAELCEWICSRCIRKQKKTEG